jgi:hypothetical protein
MNIRSRNALARNNLCEDWIFTQEYGSSSGDCGGRVTYKGELTKTDKQAPIHATSLRVHVPVFLIKTNAAISSFASLQFCSYIRVEFDVLRSGPMLESAELGR